MAATSSRQQNGFNAPPALPKDNRFQKTYPLPGALLKVYDAGTFEDKKTHEIKSFDAGIKLVQNGHDDIRLSARFLSELHWLLTNDEELKTFVRARIAVEKSHEHEF